MSKLGMETGYALDFKEDSTIDFIKDKETSSDTTEKLIEEVMKALNYNYGEAEAFSRKLRERAMYLYKVTSMVDMTDVDNYGKYLEQL